MVTNARQKIDAEAIQKPWKTVPLSELLEFRNGVNAEKRAYGTGVPFINVLEVITNSHLRIGDIPGHVSLSPDTIREFGVRHGDLVFNRTSETQEELGLCSTYLDDEPVVFGGFVIRGRPKTKCLDPVYAAYALRAQSIRSQIVALGQGAIRANIGQSDLNQVVMPLPSRAEQGLIGEALTDVDALLASLGQLIAKKRVLKQAAMEELLTGQKRLPGFAEVWNSRPIESFSYFVTKGATPTTYGFNWEHEGVLFLRSECVSANGLDLTQSMRVSRAAHASLIRGEVRSGDILITITGNVGRVVHLSDDFGTALINQHIARIRIKDSNVSAHYVFHWLSQAAVRKHFTLITTGQAYPQISLKQVRETQVPLPSPSEQAAIATILSDMDSEIAGLEKRHYKALLLQQGMMQELLTGKMRLV